MRRSLLAVNLVVCLASITVLACGGGPGDGFVSVTGPEITTAAGGGTPASSTSGDAGSTGSADSTSTTSGAASHTSAASTTSGEASTSAAASTGTIYDLGSGGDLGPLQPPGCNDKIDFLFMMQRNSLEPESQQKLLDALPVFITTIQERFAGFDLHIMVIDSDWQWGWPSCEEYGCIDTNNNGCQTDKFYIPDYPCGVYDAFTEDECNIKLGAGVIFNAGLNASNVPCAFDDDRRYITQDQSDLVDTFVCMAKVGDIGSERIGEPIVRAVSPEFNEVGGCNAGFVRDDALLMITIVASVGDEVSADTPKKWAEAVFAAKNGDKDSVIVLGIGGWDDPPEDSGRPGDFIARFPYHHFGHSTAPSYGAHFDAALELVDEACKVFTPG